MEQTSPLQQEARGNLKLYAEFELWLVCGQYEGPSPSPSYPRSEGEYETYLDPTRDRTLFCHQVRVLPLSQTGQLGSPEQSDAFHLRTGALAISKAA